MRLGIGISTYNRLPYLRDLVGQVSTRTYHLFDLVVADDGSTDGTVEWCREQGIPVVTGENRGAGWNKNRLLWRFLNMPQCDVVILLEEDIEVKVWWDRAWVQAAQIWGHVNTVRDIPFAEHVYDGVGSPTDPFWVYGITAQIIATTREDLRAVGYLDPRFRGFGWEHVEWTWRFKQWLDTRWSGRPGYPCLYHGYWHREAPTYRNEDEVARNKELMDAIQFDGVFFRDFWRTAEDREQMLREQGVGE